MVEWTTPFTIGVTVMISTPNTYPPIIRVIRGIHSPINLFARVSGFEPVPHAVTRRHCKTIQPCSEIKVSRSNTSIKSMFLPCASVLCARLTLFYFSSTTHFVLLTRIELVFSDRKSDILTIR